MYRWICAFSLVHILRKSILHIERCSSMLIREMSKEDIDFALSLTSAEGWLSTRLDFEDLIEYDPHACFIAEIDDEPIGMVCTVPYNGFGYVGNLIVIERHRQRKLGTKLMEFAISYLEGRDVMTQLLDGVQDAVSLYEQLGFRKICKSLRLEGHIKPKASDDVRFMTNKDLFKIDQYDTRLFGACRKGFLQSLLTHFPKLCRVLEIEGEVVGYIMGSERERSIRIGPWVMIHHSNRTEELLSAFATETNGQLLKIGILESNTKAMQLLQRHNFVQTSYSWRMLRGPDGDWTLSDHLYAICSPARG